MHLVFAKPIWNLVFRYWCFAKPDYGQNNIIDVYFLEFRYIFIKIVKIFKTEKIHNEKQNVQITVRLLDKPLDRGMI